MSGSEAALLARLQAGDEGALQVLYERYRAGLQARAAQRLSKAIRRKISAADVVQEAYVVAFQRLGDFEDRGEGSFGRWLGRIVDLKAKEMVRRHTTAKRAAAAEVTHDARQATDHHAGPHHTPSQIAIAAELREAARQAVCELSDDHRTVIRLLQEEHVTVEQAAVRMGRSRQATRKLYGRALAQLARRLKLDR